jgi:sulfur-oxidizing protein SoxZ
MATAHTPQLRVPKDVKAGDIVEIKTLISHEMETGHRMDSQGNGVPRKIINRFVAKFNGNEVFRADWHPSISANPYQSFFLKATVSGLLEFTWMDDDGTEYTSSAQLNVTS